jgi:hypothetical protein
MRNTLGPDVALALFLSRMPEAKRERYKRFDRRTQVWLYREWLHRLVINEAI